MRIPYVIPNEPLIAIQPPNAHTMIDPRYTRVLTRGNAVDENIERVFSAFASEREDLAKRFASLFSREKVLTIRIPLKRSDKSEFIELERRYLL